MARDRMPDGEPRTLGLVTAHSMMEAIAGASATTERRAEPQEILSGVGPAHRSFSVEPDPPDLNSKEYLASSRLIKLSDGPGYPLA